MTQYSSTVWPAMRYDNGGAVATTENGGTASPPPQTPLEPSEPTSTTVVTNAAAPAPNTSTQVPIRTTADAIRREFKIVLGSDIVTPPYPNA